MSVSSPEQNGREYKLHTETESFIEALESNGLNSQSGPRTFEEIRERSERMVDLFAGDVPLEFDGKIKEFRVPTPACREGIPVTVYIPKERGSKPSVLVYFHSGGWVSTSRQAAHATCQVISNGAKCVVVTVEYRSAPEHKPPACYDDAVCAVRWVTMNKALLGASNESTIGVGGDSIGGNIAASICHELAGINYQILAYPKLDTKCELKSYEEFEDGPVVTRQTIEQILPLCLDGEGAENVRCNPLHRPSFDHLPPALIIAAECDPVRDDSYEYSKKLKSAKVRTTLMPIKGACHTFFTFPGHFKDCCGKAHSRVFDFIKTNSGRTNLSLLT